MSVKTTLLTASVLAGIMCVIAGCSPKADLALKFSPQTSDSYEVTSEVIKDFKFEQPTLGKLREEQTKTQYRVAFTQTIVDVDAEGIATADVVIDGVAVYMTNKNEVKYTFDSAADTDKDKPLAKLIGQRYTIRVSPQGRVVSFDTAEAQKAVTAGLDAKMAGRILSEEGIRERHEIPALWDAGQNSWTQTVDSPPGLLAPKKFKKTYTLTGVENRDGRKVAVITMTAAEAGEAAKGQTAAGMGMFAKMFDSTDNFTGTLLLDVNSGRVVEYDETLISAYIAQETPENAAPDKGPDTLTMGFTHRVAMKMKK